MKLKHTHKQQTLGGLKVLFIYLRELFVLFDLCRLLRVYPHLSFLSARLNSMKQKGQVIVLHICVDFSLKAPSKVELSPSVMSPLPCFFFLSLP